MMSFLWGFGEIVFAFLWPVFFARYTSAVHGPANLTQLYKKAQKRKKMNKKVVYISHIIGYYFR